MSNFNKLITNKPVSLTEQEVANLSETLSAVRTAGGGSGSTYGGDGIDIVITGNNTIALKEETHNKIWNNDYITKTQFEQEISSYATKTYTDTKLQTKQDNLTFGYDDEAISSINGHEIAVTGDYYSASNPSGFINSDQAEAQIIAKKYITSSVSELDNFYSKSQTSGANEIANAIKDFVTEDLLEATSGELERWVDTNYYDKTETSSKTEIENAFDNIPKCILKGDSNITATSAQDGKNIRWDLAVNATPVVTDTTLTGDKGIYTHKTTNSGEWCVELVQSAYDAINDVQNKLDTTVAAQTYQPKGNYVSSTDITDMATQTWVGSQGYLTAVPSEYVTDTELQTTLEDYATNTLVQNTSAAITAMIPSTAGLASETDLQIVSAGVDYVSAHAITAHQSLTDYYTKSETSGATELSTEFAKYTKTEDLHIPTKVSDLTDSATYVTETELEAVSGEITALIPTNYVTSGEEISGNKQYGLTTAGWVEIPIEFGLSGRNFAIGVENEFDSSGGGTDILLQGYQNSGTYVDFAQGIHNSAYQYAISQGYKNNAKYESMAQGYINTANNIALAQGSTNSADYQAFAQGILNKASYDSLAQGHSNSAVDQSIAQGLENTAYHYSFAQGFNNVADMQSFAQGADNRASDYSQTIGHNLIASGFNEDDYYYGLFAIGGYNATTSNALFVVGNGSSYNGTPTRSDAFVIYKDGSVSAKGDISANGVKLGGGGGDLSNYVPFSATELPIGTNNTATNTAAAIGVSNTASVGSFALGKENTATNTACAIGSANSAGNGSFVAGRRSTAYDASVAFEESNYASGRSVAFGHSNTAKNYSFTFGRGLGYTGNTPEQWNMGAFVVGCWNNTTTWDYANNSAGSPLFIVGNGASDSNTKDAFIVYRNGAIRAGSDTTANESNSVAFGSLSQASGNCAFVAGAWCYAIGQGSHAEGNSCGTTGYGNHIQGSFNLFESTGAAYNGPANTPVFVGGTLNATTAQDYSDHGGYLQIMGNGTYQSQGTGTRSDAYILYRDGTVKAKDFIAGGNTLSANYPVPKTIPNTADNTLKVQRMFVCTSDNDIIAHVNAGLAEGEGCVFFRVGN